MFRYDDWYVILCQELLHLLDLSSDASGRCALAGRSGAKFGVMMGRCVRAPEYGRYPSSQPSHEGNPLAAMRGTRPHQGYRSGIDRRQRACDNDGLPSPSGNAARPTKSRQGYGSRFVATGPLIGNRRRLGRTESSARPVSAPKWEFPGASGVLAASRRRRDASPARSLRRARACNDLALVEVDVRCARFRLQVSEHRRNVESAAGKAPAFSAAAPKRPESMRESAYAKGKVRSKFPPIFKGELITTP
jgi:hypothetical protein